ncbi:PqiC family protein [Pseudomonas akapageensis]|uniref:PqiC family protein n=1 Tax=Pseudomonas akapageensis TaxID=2609961 RepID=UPI001409A989|nr:PqiC family protein [Pseudomonas akapageensis]
MPFSLKIPLVSLFVFLGACASDPVHYHTLMAPHAGGAPQGASADIQLERITVPPQVDRTEIVIRQGSSGLAVLEFEWWGASLADEFQSALEDQLNAGGSQRKSFLRVDVQRFDSLPGQYALLEATWRLRSMGASKNVIEMTCHNTLQTPAGASIEDLVMAHQNNVKRLAATISQATRGTSSDCPKVQ